MPDVKWIKICTDIFSDEKIKLIDALPERDAIFVIWIKLLTLAGKTNSNGEIHLSENIPYTDEMLSTIFSRPIAVVRLALKVFNDFGMIETLNGALVVTNWCKHQSIDGLEKIRHDTKLRVRKYRKLKQIEEKRCNGTVTLRNEQNRIEEKKNRRRDIAITQEELIQNLTQEPAYSHINIKHEVQKAVVWLGGHPGRKLTRNFMIRWLNKIDVPIKVYQPEQRKWEETYT